VCFALAANLLLMPAVHAQSTDEAAHDAKAAAAKPAESKPDWPPLPADAHVEQTMQLNGKTLRYNVTVGTIPVFDNAGKKAGEVVYTAYTVDGKDRPVTFAMNGGPGASSVYLNMGAIGPKRVAFGAEGDSPSDPATLTDNQGTWLDFTDLVFIDPIGTGYSRSLVSASDTKKLFYTTVPDIQYLSRVVYDWLVKNGRMASRKYFVGESYGGFRGPRITHYLQTQLGVAMNGVVLVSPYLNPTIESNGDLSPLPWMMTLPSIAAAHLEREHKLTAEAMAPIIAYTRGDYVTALLKGRSDPAATQQMIQHVTEITGLDPVFVKRSGGRLETQAYLREVYRSEGKLGSRYDPNVTAWDPFPTDPEQRSNDPILESIIAPTTTAMVNFVTQTVGWKTEARYEALSGDVNRQWDGGAELRKGSVEQLREAVANDPKMHVLIVHGWNDLSCPFMGSILTVDQMPVMGDPTRVQVKEYPGGHMFYSRHDSQIALRKDVMTMYSEH
ncbi:MAG TPA: peptidase S10, partial [Edaphobacter sp.]|nr:peptidase S10 [Edaphobacter sp.]